MTKTLNASTDLFEPIEVNLWGPKFSVKEPTRKVERATDAAMKALNELPSDAEDDTTLAAIVEVLDALLDPIPVEGEKTVRAKTVLKQKYKTEQIGIGHVNALFEQITELRSIRPT